MPTPRAPTPPDLSALPEPLRRRFLRVSRAFATGLFTSLTGGTVAVFLPGEPRRYGLLALLVGGLVAGGAFLYGLRVGNDTAPPPIDPL